MSEPSKLTPEEHVIAGRMAHRMNEILEGRKLRPAIYAVEMLLAGITCAKVASSEDAHRRLDLIYGDTKKMIDEVFSKPGEPKPN